MYHNRVMHRDIKTLNVLLDDINHLKVCHCTRYFKKGKFYFMLKYIFFNFSLNIFRLAIWEVRDS